MRVLVECAGRSDAVHADNRRAQEVGVSKAGEAERCKFGVTAVVRSKG